MKPCSACGSEKPLEEFNADARRRDGRKATCRSCQAAERRAKRDRIRERNQRRYQECGRAKYHEACRHNNPGYQPRVKAAPHVPRKRLQIPVRRIKRAIQLREQGKSWAHCAMVLGVYPKALRLAVYDHLGVPEPKAKRAVVAAPEVIAKARELRAQRVRWKAIERELGISWRALADQIYRQNKAAQQTR